MTELRELYRIAEEEEIQVDRFPLRQREALAVMDDEGRCAIALDPRALRSGDEERLKLAHELGHCCTGSFYNRWATCDTRQRHENTADKWAIAHLVPRDELDEAIAQGYTEFWSLAEYFGVTEAFLRKAVCWYVHGNLAAELYF